MNEWTFSPIPEISANFAKIRKFSANQHFLCFLINFLSVSWNSGQNLSKFCWKITKFWNFLENFRKNCKKKFTKFLLKIWDLSGEKECKSCRSRKMLQNASFLAIVAVRTEENEPPKIWGPKFHYFNRLLSHDTSSVIISELMNSCNFRSWSNVALVRRVLDERSASQPAATTAECNVQPR